MRAHNDESSHYLADLACQAPKAAAKLFKAEVAAAAAAAATRTTNHHLPTKITFVTRITGEEIQSPCTTVGKSALSLKARRSI